MKADHRLRYNSLQFQRGKPPPHPTSGKETHMILEPNAAQPDALFYDEDSEEIMNDSLGTISFTDSTGMDLEKETEEEREIERLGYSTDERQD